MKNKHKHINLLREGFDFNNAIEDSLNDNNTTLNDISNKLQFDNAIVNLRSIIKTSPYNNSEIKVFNDNQCIVIKFYKTPQKPPLENSISIMFLIKNDNIQVYYQKYNDYMHDDMSVITKITISFLQYLMSAFNIKNHEIYIVKQVWDTRLFVNHLNNYKTLQITYKESKFLLDMINNGFTNIHYIVDKAGVNALSYDVTFIKPENVGNIIFTNSNDGNSENIYTLNISKLFDYITTHDILPEKGYVLFNKMLIATTITDKVIKYLNLIATCKFNDNATINASQNIKVKITKDDVKRVIDNVMYVSKSKENNGILKITQAIKDNASHKLYARLVLSAILSGDIDKILNQYKDFNKFVEIDVTTLKVYYNYVIEDIKNNGPIYNLILSNLK